MLVCALSRYVLIVYVMFCSEIEFSFKMLDMQSHLGMICLDVIFLLPEFHMPQEAVKGQLMSKATPVIRAWHHAVFALLLMHFYFFFGCRELAIWVFAWKGQVHGLYELLNRQVADPFVPCQPVQWCSAVWTWFTLVFVCTLLTKEVAVLALNDVPFFWNV